MKYKKKLVKFKDLGKIITGKTPRTKNKSYWNGTIKFLTPRDMQDGKYSSYTERYITQKGADSVKNSILKNPSISVSCIGNIGYVTYNREKMITNQQINSIIPNEKYDSHYLYYAMKNYNKEFKMLENQSTTISILNKTEFSNLEIKVFDNMKVQEQISRVLSSLDDKIELNNKINKNLEDLAQTLYKQWFVDFEFPNEEGLPYKSSGGKMVESELGLIPEGWNIEPLGNSKISKLVTSGINEFNNEKIYLATADVTDTTITNRNTTITMKDKPSRANMQPRENTLWFAKMKNSRKLIRVSKNSTELISDYIFSTGFAGLYVKEYLNFVWTFLLTSSFDENKNGLASGTTQEAINNRNINKINLIVPKDRILNKFEEIFNDIYEKIEQNDNENQKLANLRDLLLPKLMSGEIRLPIEE